MLLWMQEAEDKWKREQRQESEQPMQHGQQGQQRQQRQQRQQIDFEKRLHIYLSFAYLAVSYLLFTN